MHTFLEKGLIQFWILWVKWRPKKLNKYVDRNADSKSIRLVDFQWKCQYNTINIQLLFIAETDTNEYDCQLTNDNQDISIQN